MAGKATLGAIRPRSFLKELLRHDPSSNEVRPSLQRLVPKLQGAAFFFIGCCLQDLLSGALKLGNQLLFDFPHPKDVERSMRGFHSLTPALAPSVTGHFCNDPNGYLVTLGLYAYFNPKTREMHSSGPKKGAASDR